MWVDSAPVGRISLRYQPDSVELPPHARGHIGYETFPWAQRRSYGTSALPYVELTTHRENLASQKIIAANGGILMEEFEKPESSGGGFGWRYRITL